MKKRLHYPLAGFLFSIFGMLSSGLQADNSSKPYWQDVQVVAVNKEYPRSSFMSYDNLTDALSGKFENSRYYRILNGTWKFYYVDSYKDLPDNITSPEANTASWHDIQVPGNWEVQGHGVAIYTNHGYEFKARNPQPPLLPEATPVGVYRRDIDIPADWDGRDIFLHIAGAKSGVYVYINGQEVGYSEDSKNPAEFLINPYVKPGKNVLTLKIFRWSTGSYLECQDFWRISGIERDVFLYSQPQAALKDFRIKSTLDDTYKDGIFALSADLRNHRPAGTNLSVVYELLDKNGQVVATEEKTTYVPEGEFRTVSFSQKIPAVLTWTSEHPNLYKLLMTVKENGKVNEIVTFNVGFRRIEIKESKQLAANGCLAVCEGANMPTTMDATEYLQKNGVIFAPGKAANAGGVATSALELTQNSERLSWTFEEVDAKLQGIMVNICHNMVDAAERYGMKGNYVAGANIAGFEKVVDAMNAQGIV